MYIFNIFDKPDGATKQPKEIHNSMPSFYTLTPKEGLKDCLLHYNISHPEIVYAQAILETGHFTSSVCIKNNNLFGLYNSKTKEFYHFNHWSESVEAYANMIQYRYDDSEDYYNFLIRIGYAEDPNYINKLKAIENNNK